MKAKKYLIAGSLLAAVGIVFADFGLPDNVSAQNCRIQVLCDALVLPEPKPDPEPPRPDPDPVPDPEPPRPDPEPEPEPEPDPEPPRPEPPRPDPDPIPDPDDSDPQPDPQPDPDPVERPKQPEIQRPVPVGGTPMHEAIIAAAPAQHATQLRLKKIPNSEAPEDLFPWTAKNPDGTRKFSWCTQETYRCHKSNEVSWQYGSGDWDRKNWRFFQPPGGGHATNAVNASYMAQLTVNNGQLGVAWDRIIDPSQYVNGKCGVLESGPASQHLYAGPQYVDNHDVMFFPSGMGYYTACEEDRPERLKFHTMSGGWLIDQDEAGKWQYEQVFSAVEGDPPVKDELKIIDYARGCYLGSIDRLIYDANRMINPADWSIVPIQPPGKTGGYWSASGDFDTASDDVTSTCYWYVKARGVFGIQYDADGNGKWVYQSREGRYDTTAIEVEPISGDLLMLQRDGGARWIDTQTDHEWDITPKAGDMLPFTKYIYNQMTFIPGAHCRGLVFASQQTGIYAFTLPASVCSLDGSKVEPELLLLPQPPRELVEHWPSPNLIPSELTFEELCDQPGAVFCDPLGEDPPVKIVDGEKIPLAWPDGTLGGLPETHVKRQWRYIYTKHGPVEIVCPEPVADDEECPVPKVLRVTRPDSSRTNGGQLTTHFSDVAEKIIVQNPDGTEDVEWRQENAFMPGDDGFIEFSMMVPCETRFADCDPTGETYKTIPIGPATASGLAMQNRKIVIFRKGSAAHGYDASPARDCCDQIVLSEGGGVLFSFNNRSLTHRLPGCAGYPDMCVSGQESIQSGKDFRCWKMPDPSVLEPHPDAPDKLRAKRMQWGYHSDTCAMQPADEWVRVRIYLSLGREDELPGSNNLLQIFIAREGEPFKELTHSKIYVNDTLPYPPFGAIVFTRHSTKSAPDSGRPDQMAYFRDLIMVRTNEGKK